MRKQFLLFLLLFVWLLPLAEAGEKCESASVSIEGGRLANEGTLTVKAILDKKEEVEEVFKILNKQSIEVTESATNNIVRFQGGKIKINKILRSHSIDGKISNNTVKSIWTQ